MVEAVVRHDEIDALGHERKADRGGHSDFDVVELGAGSLQPEVVAHGEADVDRPDALHGGGERQGEKAGSRADIDGGLVLPGLREAEDLIPEISEARLAGDLLGVLDVKVPVLAPEAHSVLLTVGHCGSGATS